MEVKKKAQELYTRASNYITDGDVADTSHDIINDFVDAFLPTDEFKELVELCVAHINRWGREEMTLEEWVAESYGIVEDISGTLGEWLDK